MKNKNLTKLELELSKLLKKAIDALYDAGEDQISNSLQDDMEKAMNIGDYYLICLDKKTSINEQ